MLSPVDTEFVMMIIDGSRLRGLELEHQRMTGGRRIKPSTPFLTLGHSEPNGPFTTLARPNALD